MNFRITLPVDAEQPADDLCETQRVLVQLVYQAGRWRGQCADPPLTTVVCDTMEEALISAVKELTKAWASRPATSSAFRPEPRRPVEDPCSQ